MLNRGLISFVIVLGLALSLIYWNSFKQSSNVKIVNESSLDDYLTADEGGFEKVTNPRKFSFPRDHGPHHRYRTEWWYFTGNLQSKKGRKFGY